jgi:hypothetical protein
MSSLSFLCALLKFGVVPISRTLSVTQASSDAELPVRSCGYSPWWSSTMAGSILGKVTKWGERGARG